MSLIKIIRELIASRELLLALLRKEIKVRYSQSSLGALWAFLQPLILLGLFMMLHKFMGIESGNYPYPVVAYAALLPWTFFANAITLASGTIVANAAIIRKIYCPRIIFPLASLLIGLFDLFIASLVFAGLMVYYNIQPTVFILFVPLLLLHQFLLLSAIAMITSSCAAYRRDILIGMPFIMQFWLFASPVMYRIESVPTEWRIFYSLNPMVGILEGYRSLLVYGIIPDFKYIGISFFVSIFLFIIGLYTFYKLESRFADVV